VRRRARGPDLLFTGDDWFSRYWVCEGPSEPKPERIAPMRYGEHGGHGIRQGPDGWWYVIGGNHSGFTPPTARDLAGFADPLPGCRRTLRFSPDFGHCEVVACGFRHCGEWRVR
jgi:hypothetical protein